MGFQLFLYLEELEFRWGFRGVAIIGNMLSNTIHALVSSLNILNLHIGEVAHVAKVARLIRSLGYSNHTAR